MKEKDWLMFMCAVLYAVSTLLFFLTVQTHYITLALLFAVVGFIYIYIFVRVLSMKPMQSDRDKNPLHYEFFCGYVGMRIYKDYCANKCKYYKVYKSKTEICPFEPD